MSEAISIGIAVIAAGACAAIIGAGKKTYQALTWISDQALREMERLEEELNTCIPNQSFSEDVIQEFEKKFKTIKTKLANNPTLKSHTDTLAQVMSLRNSALGSFVSDSQWKQLHFSPLNQRSYRNILFQAKKSYAQANARYISQSVIAVGTKLGLNQQKVNRVKDNTNYLTLMDDKGRALLARVMQSEKGSQLHLDLTGFGDGACHTMMDAVLNGLKEKQINIHHLKRRSHYCRNGMTKEKKSVTNKASKKKIRSSHPDERLRKTLHYQQKKTMNP